MPNRKEPYVALPDNLISNGVIGVYIVYTWRSQVGLFDSCHNAFLYIWRAA